MKLKFGTVNPDSSALLEVKSENKGFLPPRVILIADNNPSPISKPAQGLLVYNIVNAGASPQNVYPGYYFWNGSKWTSLENRCSNVGEMQYWNGSGWSSTPIGSQHLTMKIRLILMLVVQMLAMSNALLPVGLLTINIVGTTNQPLLLQTRLLYLKAAPHLMTISLT